MFNKQIKFISRKPFTLFKIDNFFSNEFYTNLEDNFPDLENLKINGLNDFKNKKYAFDTSSDIHNLQIKSNTTFIKFEEIIYSNEFFNFFFNNLYLDFIKSRLKKPSHLIKLLKYPRLVKNLNKEGFLHFITPLNKIKIEIQYSYILNKGKIVPHTDSGEKLLSLMLYFPSKNYDKQKQKKLGTNFWTSNFENFENFHQNDDKNLKDKKLFYKTSFESNVLFGFIKNQASWHSVEPIDMGDDFVRRSININFYF